jgi:hypothetical protein
MSASTQHDIFTEVINDMMKELHTIPHSTDTIYRLIINNLDSPILAEIDHLSLSELDTTQMATLVPAFGKMSRLTSLELPACKPSQHHLKFIFTECPALSKLQSLDLRSMRELKSNDLHLLSQSTTLTALTSLNLSYCNATTSRAAETPSSKDSSGLIALLSSPIVQGLTHLNLGFIVFHDPLIHTTIATSPHLSNLVSLDLSMTKVNLDAVTALAASTTLVNLTSLSLPYNQLGDELTTQLFSPSTLLVKKLQSLDLRQSRITVSALEAVIAASPHLTELNLVGNDKLGPAGAALIATSMPNLTKLDLSDCGIAAEGYNALATSTTLPNLRELNLYGDRAAKEPIIALVNSPIMANLTLLNLGETHKGPEVLTAIAQSTSMTNLQRLEFYGNQAGDDAIIALARSATLTNLTWLNLANNDIGPDGANALFTSPVVSKLTYLGLAHNPHLGNSAATALAAPSSTLYSLVELNLWGSGMDDKGAKQLLAATNLDQLDVLGTNSQMLENEQTKAVHQARFDH